MQLTTIEQEYVQKCVEKASWEVAERFQHLHEEAIEASKEAGSEAEIEGLGPDEVEAAYDKAGARAWEEVGIRDAFGDDPPPGLIFCQPSESAYIEAAEEEAENRGLATLAAQGTIEGSGEIEDVAR